MPTCARPGPAGPALRYHAVARRRGAPTPPLQPTPESDPAMTTPASAPAPLIAIFPRAEERANDNGHACFAQTPLIRGVQAAGGIPVMLSPTEDPAALARYIEAFDGFLIPGGGDIEPSCYGEGRSPQCGPVEYVRDAFELALVPRILEADKPLFGICRGNQLLDVACGGTLWQDIPSQPESTPIPLDEPLKHDNDHPFDLIAHTVDVLPETLLARIVEPAAAQAGLDPRRLPVNSLHHQSVRRVGDGLVVNALAPDGTVEGLELPGRRFALTVQWHPEFLWENDPVSMALFRAFVDAARA